VPNEKKETKTKLPPPKKERSYEFEDAVEKLELDLEEVKKDIVDLVLQRFYRA
jgi:hypothetical protein